MSKKRSNEQGIEQIATWRSKRRSKRRSAPVLLAAAIPTSSGQKGNEMSEHAPNSGALLAKSRVRGPTVTERREEEQRALLEAELGLEISDDAVKV